MNKKVTITALLFCPTLALADSNGLGFAASNINSIIAFVYDIVDVILYIGAAILGMSGLLKYRLHRQNPQQVPLSTPVTELAIAGVLVLIGFLVQLSASYKSIENPNLPNVNIGPNSYAPPPSTPTNPYPH